jgi:hypothetical protein
MAELRPAKRYLLAMRRWHPPFSSDFLANPAANARSQPYGVTVD